MGWHSGYLKGRSLFWEETGNLISAATLIQSPGPYTWGSYQWNRRENDAMTAPMKGLVMWGENTQVCNWSTRQGYPPLPGYHIPKWPSEWNCIDVYPAFWSMDFEKLNFIWIFHTGHVRRKHTCNWSTGQSYPPPRVNFTQVMADAKLWLTLYKYMILSECPPELALWRLHYQEGAPWALGSKCTKQLHLLGSGRTDRYRLVYSRAIIFQTDFPNETGEMFIQRFEVWILKFYLNFIWVFQSSIRHNIERKVFCVHISVGSVYQ